MINYIWMGLFAVGIVTAAFTGKMGEVSAAVFDAAKTSVELAIGLIGIMALWLGLMKIAEQGGAVAFISRLLHPLLKKLFPGIPKGHPAMGSIVANFAANMMGLGNSATALGLKAMQDLQELNEDKESASNEMCTFLVINTSSVTIIPATIIGIRAAAGAANPADIIGAVLFATTASTVTAIIAVKLLERLNTKKRKGA